MPLRSPGLAWIDLNDVTKVGRVGSVARCFGFWPRSDFCVCGVVPVNNVNTPGYRPESTVQVIFIQNVYFTVLFR